MMRNVIFAGLIVLIPAASLAQTPTPVPSEGAVKGDETDQMRANDTPCLAKMHATMPAPQNIAGAKAMLKFMRQCKQTGP